MSKQHNETPFFGPAALAGLAGLITFVGFLVVGGFDFSSAAFLAALIAAAVFIVMLWAFSIDTDAGPDALSPRNVNGAPPSVSAPDAAVAGHSASDAAAPAVVAEAADDTVKAATAPAEESAAEETEAESKVMAVAAAAAGSGSEDYDGDGEEEGADEGTKPEMLSEARDGGPDNLKEIKGVGPAMETLLQSLGVFHFDQVASWNKDELAWVDANLKGFKGRASRDNWVDQAKVLAAGGETEFSKRVDEGNVY
jgi:predicted flap endonuclease-1-like 5' DNA nuclease